jgi:sulfonate transport system substrate-binding protein
MFTRRRFAASLAAIPLLAAPAVLRAAPQSPPRLRFGVAMAGLGGRPYSLGSVVAVVHVQGLLEKEFAADGTSIEWQFFAGAGPAVNEALANNALDFAWQGDLPEIVARSRGLGTKQLFVAGNRSPVFVVAAKDSSINSLADLKGKTVANFQGTNLQLSVDRILQTAGLTEQDLQIVNLDQVTAVQAVAEHQIDASFVQLGVPPHAENLLKVIFHSGPAQPTLTPQASVITTEAFSIAYPQAVDRVVRVSLQAAHWAAQPQNRDALYAIFAKTGYPLPYIQKIFDPLSPLVGSSPLWDPFQLAQLNRSTADAYKFGLIRTPVDTSQWIDQGPLDRALAALGLQSYWPKFAPDGVTRVG